MKSKPLNKKVSQIINFISKSENLATANEISKKTGIAYVTVQKYLKQLLEQKILITINKDDIKSGEKSKSVYYSIDYNYLRSSKV